jgi:hypothetical protein
VPRINWDSTGSRFFEAGVDRGVLFTQGNPGVPWSGLVSVTEKSSGGGSTAYYVDGQKYLNVSADEEYGATIEAYTYPDEFYPCDGFGHADTGLFVTQQPKQSFGFSYRTMVGSDTDANAAYKIHLVYNALANPSQRANHSLKDSPETTNFSWDISVTPEAMPGFKPSSHLVIDTRIAHPGAVSDVEDVIYGTDSTESRLPLLDELITIFDTNALFVVTDNGDGTWTATAPDELGAIVFDDSTHFTISWPSAVPISDTLYTLSSL